MPDHSRLTRIRERSGLQDFRRFFAAIVELCLQAGLVWGRELDLDATKVEAHAALDSVAPRFAVEAHLATLVDAPEAGVPGCDAGGAADEPVPLPIDLTTDARTALAEVATGRRDWIGGAGRPEGRQVKRNFDEAYLDRGRNYRLSEASQKARRMRQVWGEPLVAEAKLWHGLGRFRLRGLRKVNSEALFIAAGQNRKRLLSWWAWGRRPFPSGAAGVVRSALPPVPVPTG